MAGYKFTNQAVADLNGIWEYTFFQWSENQADKYYNSLLKTCQKIAKNPQIGKRYRGVRVDLLGVKIKKHIVFYRIVGEDFIEITRILHERMDFQSRLDE
ncbi:MAG: type II toxin-antitoxin system RelE/ParE family toxin [Flavobacteriaceae bacterium]|nr:type II toxin-antitoxin system RelE/ParE family toxin [Flavobacteriaceae bacterium]